MFEANENRMVQIDGTPQLVRRGDLVPAGHALVKRCPDLFAPDPLGRVRPSTLRGTRWQAPSLVAIALLAAACAYAMLVWWEVGSRHE